MIGLAVKSIEKEHGIKIDANVIMRNPTDPKVFELIASGKTQNLFQFNSIGMQGLCKRAKPTKFMDCVAITSLYRPAALGNGDTWKWCDIKNGLEEVHYSHPEEEQITGETYGIITFQEDVMHLVNHFAGWTLGKGDSLRKKSADELEAMRDEFISDSCDLYNEEYMRGGTFYNQMDELWTRIVNYMGYGFNKSHGVAYTMITYITGWLETYYPEHWLSAIMSTKMGDQEIIAQGFQDIKHAGFDFQAPDINQSELIFTANSGKIVFPLSVIKGVGDKAVEEVMEARSQGVFTSLEDFMSRVNLRRVNTKVMRHLIFAGAFDSLYPSMTRLGVYCKYKNLKGMTKKEKESLLEEEQQGWNDEVKAKWEKDLLGVFISTHPLARYHFKNWQEYRDGDWNALIGGVVTKVKTFMDKNKQRMSFLTVDTLQCPREVVVFASTYKKYEGLLVEGATLMLTGKKDGEKMLLSKAKELN